HQHAHHETVKVFKRMSKSREINRIFIHSSSKAEWTKFARDVGVEEKLHHVYEKTGNIVSASIPAGITDAIENEKIKRGDEIVFWVGSAGMSFNATRATY
ncbi:MAG: 3-oxoacyl-[acyl-carrier-protein] synthase III C-terminal domain-containing protein, partial [Gammaproteobacteria bacterium]